MEEEIEEVYKKICDIAKKSGKYNLLAKYRLLKYIDKYGINYQYSHERQTIFMILMILRRIDLLKLIIRKDYHDIDMNVTDWCGRTVLHFVIDMYDHTVNSDNCTYVMKYIIKCGGNVNQRDKYGGTPLGALVGLNYRNGSWIAKSIHQHMRYDGWKIDKIILLIESGAHINLCDDHGYTPLMIACDISSPDINDVKILLDYGANIYDKVYHAMYEKYLFAIDLIRRDTAKGEKIWKLLDKKHTELINKKIQLINELLPFPIAECIVDEVN